MIHFTYLLLITLSFSACADPTDKEKTEFNMADFKWKNRIILSYPENEKAWAEQQKNIQQQQAQFKDRDLILLRVDEKQEHLAMIKKYGLTAGSHVLIGKDGTAKEKQSGKLKLLEFFKLIDQMPMRKAEMESNR
jgi:hypothetical protein